MSDPVLASLAKRRTELVTEVKKQEGVLRGLLADIEHLDATIRQFDPEHRQRLPPTSIGRLGRGAMTKALLTILRTAPGPMTVRTLTREVMARRGSDLSDRKVMERTTAQVRTALARQRKHGVVIAEPGPESGPHQAWLWRITGN